MSIYIQPQTEFLQFGGIINGEHHQQVLSFGAAPPDPTRIGAPHAFNEQDIDGDTSSAFIHAGDEPPREEFVALINHPELRCPLKFVQHDEPREKPKHGWGSKPSMPVDSDARYYEG